MPKLRTVVFAMLAALLLAAGAVSQPPSPPSGDQAPQGLIVKFRTAPPSVVSKGVGIAVQGTDEADRINQINEKFAVTAMKQLAPAALTDLPPALAGLTVVRGDIDRLEELKAEYESLSSVEYVEFDYPVEMYGEELLAPPIPLPSDPLFAQQWYLHNTGQQHPVVIRGPECGDDVQSTSAGTVDADIDANEVLNVRFQNPYANPRTAVVAVIDCGVDLNHPDMSGKAWVNAGETANNGLDDDNNGYVDDINGWDFAASAYNWYDEDNDPSDPWGHGTHVAGIIAAGVKNNIGISGITPSAKIMALKVFPRGLISTVISAVIYAGNQGADVINMSLGTPYPSYALEASLQFARSQGSVTVVSMGNSSSAEISYPAFYPSVIAVSATDDVDQAASFTSYGNHVDVSAPGTNILSLRASGTDMYGQPEHTLNCPEPNVHIYATDYYLMDGTSMAAPVAAGVLAYMRGMSPGLSPDAAQNILQQTANDIVYPLGPGTAYTGWDQYTGYGRVNLYGALQSTPQLKVAVVSPRPFQLLSGTVPITGMATGTGFSSYVVEYGAGIDPSSWTSILTSYTPVSPTNLLANWNTTGLTGLYTVRLRSGANHFDKVLVYVVPEAVAELTEPAESDSIATWTTVTGSAYCPNFQKYEVLTQMLTDTLVTVLSSATAPVFDGELAKWLVSSLPEGDYELRLVVYNNSGVAATDSVIVSVIHNTQTEWRAYLANRPTLTAPYADIDDDGINEILVGTWSGLAIIGPDGSPKSTPYSPPAGAWLAPVSIGDLDGDGKPDFVGLVQGETHLSLWGSLSDGFTSFEITLDTTYNFGLLDFVGQYVDMPILVLSDVDNDAKDEIFFRGYERYQLYNGYTREPRVLQFSVGSQTPDHIWNDVHDVVVDDLDDDGEKEIYLWYYRVEGPAFSKIKKLDRNGVLVDSIMLAADTAASFVPRGMSAQDVNGDSARELIVFGSVDQADSRLWALDDQLDPLSGFPQEVPLSSYMTTSMPVFGNIDSDPEPEYVITQMDGLVSSLVHAWNMDGTPVRSGNADGLYITPSMNCYLGTPLLADVTGDGVVDVIAGSVPLIGGNPPYQALWVWNTAGANVNGFPILLDTSSAFSYTRYTPVIGDVDDNGDVDLIMPTWNSSLYFRTFADVAFERCLAPVASWRYHFNFDGIGPSYADTCTEADTCRGDCNADGNVDALDVTYLSAYLTGGGPAPQPLEAGDVNWSGVVDLTDLSWLISYVEYGYPSLCMDLNLTAQVDSEPLHLEAKMTREGSRNLIATTLSRDARLAMVTLGGVTDAGSINVTGQGVKMCSRLHGDTLVLLLGSVRGGAALSKGATTPIDMPLEVEVLEISAVDFAGHMATVSANGTTIDGLPREFSLAANYPNPFNPVTTISFDVPRACEYDLVIYNTLGQKVTSYSGHADPGTVRLVWDGARQASGVYFYRLTAGEFTATRKMMLLK